MAWQGRSEFRSPPATLLVKATSIMAFPLKGAWRYNGEMSRWVAVAFCLAAVGCRSAMKTTASEGACAYLTESEITAAVGAPVRSMELAPHTVTATLSTDAPATSSQSKEQDCRISVAGGSGSDLSAAVFYIQVLTADEYQEAIKPKSLTATDRNAVSHTISKNVQPVAGVGDEAVWIGEEVRPLEMRDYPGLGESTDTLYFRKGKTMLALDIPFAAKGLTEKAAAISLAKHVLSRVKGD